MSWFGRKKAKKTNFRRLGLSRAAAKRAKQTAKKNGKKTS